MAQLHPQTFTVTLRVDADGEAAVLRRFCVLKEDDDVKKGVSC